MARKFVSYSVRAYEPCLCCPCCECTCESEAPERWDGLNSLNAAEGKVQELRDAKDRRWVDIIGVGPRGGEKLISTSLWS